MNKIKLLLLLFTLTGFSLCAQHALSDAIRLRQYVAPLDGGRSIGNFRHDAESAEAALRILWNYAPVDAEFLPDAFEHNPFIGAVAGEDIILLPELFLDAITAENFKGVVNPSRQPAPSALGFSVGNIADGLARFLARRTKEELSMAFFNRLKKTIEKDPALGTLFPDTKKQLWVIDTEIFFFDRFLEVLRESFILDLKSLPRHSRMYLLEKDYAAQPELKIVVEDVLQLSQFLIDGQPIEEWFSFLAQEASLQDTERLGTLAPEAKKKLHDMGASLRLAHLLSESLRNPGLGEEQGWVWLPPAEAQKALKDPVTLYLYLGLLWQQDEALGVQFQNGKSWRTALAKVADGSVPLQSIRRFVEVWTDSGREVSQSLRAYPGSNVPNDSLSDDTVFRFFNSFFSLTEAVLQLQEALFPAEELQQAELRKLFENVRDLNSFSYNIRRRNYVYAIHNLAGVLVRLTGDDPVRRELLRYGNFMASVAEAQSSEEIAYALEMFALPPGSSATKKNSIFSVSLNAYSGLGYGREYLRNAGNGPENSDIIAFMAPIGFDVNMGFGKAGSLSFFSPLIDVGALTAFRLRNDEAAAFPELKWENILAPGAFIVYGGPSNLPIALGAGFQKGPNLRRVVDPAMPEITKVEGFRFAVFMSIDIPISHFYVH